MINSGIIARVLKTALLLPATLVVGTAWHEVVGHGLVAVACGGRITGIALFGLEIYPPTFVWAGTWPPQYGSCGTDGVTSETADALVKLGGSLSTWLVSVVAVVLLCVRRWRGRPRTILIYLGIWWIDLLTYTLPTWGVPKSIFWGRLYSEPYEAATRLGVPGPLFQAWVVGSSVILAGALIAGLRRRGERAARACDLRPRRPSRRAS
ncbi:MAG: hypothetical protein ACE5E1_10930 [Phycisphaerae bacterium]